MHIIILLAVLVTSGLGKSPRCEELPPHVTKLPQHAFVHEALQLSKAAYDAYPRLYLQNKHIQPNHDFTSVAVGADSQRVTVWVLGESPTALYVGIRGSATFDDALIDIQVMGQFQRNFAAIHSGFRKRASAIPIPALVDYAHARDKTLIFTGHSLGGSVAHVATLVACEYAAASAIHIRIYSIAFAAPVFGDQALQATVSSSGHTDRLLTISVEGDLVPTLMAFQFASLRTLAAQVPDLPSLLASDPATAVATQFVLNGILNYFPARMIFNQVVDTLISAVKTEYVSIGKYWHLISSDGTRTISDYLPFPSVIASKLQGHLVQHEIDNYDHAIGDACLLSHVARAPKQRPITSLRVPVNITNVTIDSGVNFGMLSITIEGTNFGFIRPDSIAWAPGPCSNNKQLSLHVVGRYTDAIVLETAHILDPPVCALTLVTWFGERESTSAMLIGIIPPTVHLTEQIQPVSEPAVPHVVSPAPSVRTVREPVTPESWTVTPPPAPVKSNINTTGINSFTNLMEAISFAATSVFSALVDTVIAWGSMTFWFVFSTSFSAFLAILATMCFTLYLGEVGSRLTPGAEFVVLLLQTIMCIKVFRLIIWPVAVYLWSKWA